MVAFLLAATEGAAEEHSETLFFVAGILLAAFAVLVSAGGLARSRFPEAGARAVMALSAVLVAFTMAAAVISSG